jgi:multidrug efflux system membrane fusion protein
MTLASVRTTDYVDKINQAQSLVSEAEAGLAAARPALERAERLYASQSLARPELEQARAAVAAMEAKRDGARALVQEAENARADTDLVSPLDGIVLRRLVEVGSLVGPGVGGFVLADVSEVRAVFGAPDTLLRRLRVGATAPVRVEAVPGRDFVGRITKIAPAADIRSRIFDVELTLPNARGDLRVGMVASIGIDQATLGGAPETNPAGELLIPLSAVVRSDTRQEGYAVFVIEGTDANTVARQRTVTLGNVIGSRIAVIDGLREGDRVVVSGATIIGDGDPVQVVQ